MNLELAGAIITTIGLTMAAIAVSIGLPGQILFDSLAIALIGFVIYGVEKAGLMPRLGEKTGTKGTRGSGMNWKLVGLIIAIIGAGLMGLSIYLRMSGQVFLISFGVAAFGLAICGLEKAGLIPRLGAAPP